ncbi:MAG: cellulase family glycosylhydrolase [Armatimonadetes bacterium]|nr:cellulase family glycosylhydrolase [Armatimonadota bacterium]
MSQPIRIHPENPRLFEYRGKPLVLLTATEHYGAVMNRPFRYERYLEDAVGKGMTLTRLFVLFRELQNHCNPYSTCKPESPDYIAPYERTGPGRAQDGEPKFDLDRPNPEFYQRLHAFMARASELGIIVELVLLSNTYEDRIWALNPLNSANNVNGLQPISWPTYMTLRHPELVARQMEHVRRIVREVNAYDNLFFEICNEPGGCHPGEGNPGVDEVNEWERAIAAEIRQTEASLPKRHLIAGQEAFQWHPFVQGSTLSFRDFPLDIVNMHPLPGTTLDGVEYDMGQFMSKQLKLRAVRDYCLAAAVEGKPLNLDEDNVASQYKDYDGWTIHRKRAWMALMCGAHYDYIDFSIINHCETGTEASQRCIRTWFRHLSRFIHGLDLVAARPLRGIVTSAPEQTVEAAFGVAGSDISVYVADERELGEPGAGEPIRGALTLSLPDGSYSASCLSPEAGQWSPAVTVAGGNATTVALPEFRHDILVRVRATIAGG